MYSKLHQSVIAAIEYIITSPQISVFMREKGLTPEDIVSSIMVPIIGKVEISEIKCAEMLSKKFDDAWNPDGDHCIVYFGGKGGNQAISKGQIHRHHGVPCKGKYVCDKCENTKEGKNVLKMLLDLQDGDLEVYRENKRISRCTYVQNKLASKNKAGSRVAMDSGKVNVRSCIYTHDRRYLRCVDDGLVIEKCESDEGTRNVTIGIDVDNNGTLKMIRKKDIEEFRGRSIWYDVASVHPKSVKYLNKRCSNKLKR